MRILLRQIFREQSAFTVGDLICLAAPDVKDDPAAHLQTVFNWYFERATMIVRLSFGTAAGSFASLFGAALDDQGGFEVLLLLGAGVAGASIGVVQLRLLAHLHREFVEAVRLLGALRVLVA
jgi:hypothetical protein